MHQFPVALQFSCCLFSILFNELVAGTQEMGVLKKIALGRRSSCKANMPYVFYIWPISSRLLASVFSSFMFMSSIWFICTFLHRSCCIECQSEDLTIQLEGYILMFIGIIIMSVSLGVVLYVILMEFDERCNCIITYINVFYFSLWTGCYI